MDEPSLPPSASVALEQLLATDRHVTIGEIFDGVQERAFGLLLIILGLPMLIPVLPPGASTLIGTLYVILAVQLFVGMERPWLPARLRRRPLSQRAIRGLRERGVPLLRRLERFSRRRFHVLNSRLMVRVTAIVIFAMGVILLSPAPFLNFLPTVAVMLIGFGLVNDDGVFVLAGTAIGTGVVFIVVATLDLVVDLGRRLLSPLLGR